MGVINSGSFPKNKIEGVFAWIGLEYKKHPEYWRELFYETTSEHQYEEVVSTNTFTPAPVKDSGGQISYGTESQAYTTRVQNVARAQGYIITREEKDDDKYPKLTRQRGSRLARSFIQAKEIDTANLFNRAFNSTYVFGDGKEMCATDHPTLYGNQSNELATAADMTDASVKDLCVQISRATDNVGNKFNLMPYKLIYEPENMFNATEILESELKSDTAENAINSLRSKGHIPYHMCHRYLDDTNAWFILTDIAKTENGLLFFQRVPFEMAMDKDSNNMNEKHFGYERYSRTCADWRAVYGSPGA